MPAHHFAQRALQSLIVECACEPQAGRHIVGSAVRFQLLDEPQSLLCKRQWQQFISSYRQQGWHRHSSATAQCDIDTLSQPGNSWLLEQTTQRNVYRQHTPQPRDDLRRQQGMSTKSKEVVRHSYSLNVQHITPHLCNELFYWRPRRNVVSPRINAFGGRQRTPVNLPVGS